MNLSFDEARSELEKAQTRAMWPYFLPGSGAPVTLHHYTDALGLHGILKSKVLWASDLQFLNDRSELVYGHKLIRDYLLRRPGPIAAALVRGKNPVPDARKQLYVVSFCEQGDLLSQWRGYSRPQDGYSMAFQFASLQACKNVFPTKILYEIREQEETLGILVDSVTDVLSRIDLPEERTTELIRLADYIVWATAFRLKDSSFAGECEWRLVAGLASGYTEDFRVVDGHFVPYIKVPFDPRGLIEIRQGPGEYRAANLDALKRLLAVEAFLSTKVERSPVPL